MGAYQAHLAMVKALEVNMRGIVITGASSGLGSALAIEYAASGIALGLIGRNSARLDDVAGQCVAKGAVVEVGAFDVRDDDALKEWVSAFDARFPLELVIINAGVTGSPDAGKILECRDVAQALVEVNFESVVKTSEVVVPLLLARKAGKIAFVSSLAAWRGMALTPVYSATKAAVKAYAEALCEPLSSRGVQVSLICPGFVDTPMSAKFPGPRPLMVSAQRAAGLIRHGLDRGRFYIAFPRTFDFGLRVLSVFPFKFGGLFLKLISLNKESCSSGPG